MYSGYHPVRYCSCLTELKSTYEDKGQQDSHTPLGALKKMNRYESCSFIHFMLRITNKC